MNDDIETISKSLTLALDEKDRLRAENEGLRGELDLVEKDNDRMTTEYLAAKAENERLRAERDDARIQRDTAMTTLELSLAERERLWQEVLKYGAEVEGLREKLSEWYPLEPGETLA
jgi:uncharacterized protein (DUF3084 family)